MQKKNCNGYDDIYKNLDSNIGDFVFDKTVVDVFSNMINRSVPGYELILKMTGEMSKKFIQNNTRCYDFGCSLLGSTLSVIHQNKDNFDKKFDIIAIDNSEAMIEKAKKIYANYIKENNNKNVSLEFQFQDINNVHVENCSFGIMNFVLQFFDSSKRFDLLKKIYDGMLPKGAFLISEKVNFLEDNVQDFQQEMYFAFKKLNGYSDLEISKKRNALENVLVSDPIQVHIDRLKEVGFSEVYQWFQCFNFVSFLAVK
jgi:tRNA (cmo5U34)-methyltransferase